MLKVPILSQGKNKTILFSHFNTPAVPGTWKKENLIFPNDLKINVFVEGEFNVFCDQKNHRPVYGEICVFSPLKMHYGHITKNTHLNYYQFDIGISAFAGIPDSDRIIKELIEKVRCGDSFSKPSESTVREIFRLCNEIEAYTSQKDFAMSYIRCFEFIRLLHRIYSSKDKTVSQSLSYHVRSAIRYIENNFSENLTVSLIAKLQNISEGYLSRSFKKETGMNFNDYVQRYRVEQSCTMLKNSDKKIYDIARAVGYNDLKYFNNIFKRIMGMTPYRFRKM